MSAFDFAARNLALHASSRINGHASRTDLQALSPSSGDHALLKEAGREGEFRFDASDLSTKVGLDTCEGIYIAPASHPTGASGAWVRIHSPGTVELRWFGAACDGVADDTAALQCAFDVCDAHFLPSFALLGNQYPRLVADGLIRLTGTVYPSRNSPSGFCGLFGHTPYSLGIIWDHTADATHLPVFDNGAKGENFKLVNCVMTVAVGSTLPATWIKTTALLDWSFSVDGSYFGPAEDSCIECAGVANLFLRNFRFRETNRTFLKINGSGGNSLNRLIAFRDWTMHPAAASTMTSVVEISLAGSDQFTVRFEGQRIELEHDGIDPANFDLVKITGATNQATAVVVEIDGGGLQVNNGSYSGALGIIRSVTTGNEHVALRMRDFRMGAIDHFVAGNIADVSKWPSPADFVLQLADFEFSTAGVEAFSGGLYTQPLSVNPTQTSASPATVSANTADLGNAQGNVLVVSATADTTLTTLSNRGTRDFILIRRAGSFSITISSGADFIVPQPIKLDTNAYVGFAFDYNANKWLLVENVIKQTGSSIASPSADVASLKTAVDAIRATLTASGVTN